MGILNFASLKRSAPKLQKKKPAISQEIPVENGADSTTQKQVKIKTQKQPESAAEKQPDLSTADQHKLDQVNQVFNTPDLDEFGRDKLKLIDKQNSIMGTEFCRGCLRWSVEALGSPVEKWWCMRDMDKDGDIEFKVIRPHHAIAQCKYRKESVF